MHRTRSEKPHSPYRYLFVILLGESFVIENGLHDAAPVARWARVHGPDDELELRLRARGFVSIPAHHTESACTDDDNETQKKTHVQASNAAQFELN